MKINGLYVFFLVCLFANAVGSVEKNDEYSNYYLNGDNEIIDLNKEDSLKKDGTKKAINNKTRIIETLPEFKRNNLLPDNMDPRTRQILNPGFHNSKIQKNIESENKKIETANPSVEKKNTRKPKTVSQENNNNRLEKKNAPGKPKFDRNPFKKKAKGLSEESLIETNEYLNFKFDYTVEPQPPFAEIDKSALINESNFETAGKPEFNDIELGVKIKAPKENKNIEETLIDFNSDKNKNYSKENQKSQTNKPGIFQNINAKYLVLGVFVITVFSIAIIYFINFKMKKSYFDDETQTKAGDYYRKYLSNLQNNQSVYSSDDVKSGYSETENERDISDYSETEKSATKGYSIEDKIEKIRIISKKYSGKM
ncbi:MAG TPA: hypothetical protein PKY81_02550 [bacterium]|nr:hypothetical protein [bacterium]HPN29816.1 hypothetical protein [bacterium]